MTLYFMQQRYNIPIINEAMVGCPLSEFLQQPQQIQLDTVRPSFAEFYANSRLPPLRILFADLLLFYGTAAFDYDQLIQVTEKGCVYKEQRGLRSLKIIGRLL